MKGFLGLMLALLSITSFADQKVLDVHEKDSSFVVSFPANPSTGYQWTVAPFDTTVLTLSESRFEAQAGMPGAGGTMHFTFQVQPVKRPASTDLTFKYGRSWESGYAKKVQVKVNFVK